MMKKIEKIYVAYIKFPQIAGDIKFDYSEIQIVRRYNDMVEVEGYYFTSMHHSTRYFDRTMLDVEYKITDSLTCYYSDSKEKCIEWLSNKRADLLKSYEFNYNRLKKSIVKEESE